MKNNILIIILTFFLAFPSLVNGEPIQVQVDYSEPWGYYQPSGNKEVPQNDLKGIWIDILLLFTQHTGIEFTTTIAPHARVLKNLEHGKTDMSFQIRPDQDNENIIYIAEMFKVLFVVVSMKNNAVKSYEDLMGKRIGMVRGTKINRQFDNDTSLFKQAFRNYEIVVTMLFQNRLDVVVGDSVSIPYLMKKKGFSDIYNYSFPLQKSSIWLQLSVFSMHKNKSKRLIKANEIFKQQGFYKIILNRYIDYNM